MRFLFIYIGESYRKGGQYSRTRGHPESVQGQETACVSHMAFMAHLLSEHIASRCDVIINTYTTLYDNDLKAIYAPWTINSKFNDNVVGYTSLFLDSLSMIRDNLNDYHYVMFIRIDLYLKPLFTSKFVEYYKKKRLTNSITYSSVCWLKGCEVRHGPCAYPRIADMMVGVPSLLFRVFDEKALILEHNGYVNLIKHGVVKENIGFFVETYHDSDSEKDWNPLYRIVNRSECDKKKWYSKGYVMDQLTFEKIPSDENYDDPQAIFIMSLGKFGPPFRTGHA